MFPELMLNAHCIVLSPCRALLFQSSSYTFMYPLEKNSHKSPAGLFLHDYVGRWIFFRIATAVETKDPQLRCGVERAPAASFGFEGSARLCPSKCNIPTKYIYAD